jgi:LacI family transcriptional regulator
MDKPQRGRKPSRSSLQQTLADALRRRIADRQLAPGSKLPTIKTEFGVSTMTVFKAVEVLERENHVYRVAGLGAFVKADPEVPNAKAGTALGFSAGNLASPLTLDIMHGVERACHQEGWGVQIFDGEFNDERQLRNIERLKAGGLAGGIIMPPCGPACVDLLSWMARTGFPLVFVDTLPLGVESDFVASDHEGGAYRAASHLLERGFEQVHMLTYPPEFSSVAGRIRGYKHALRQAGIEPREEWMIWIDREQYVAGYATGRKWSGGYAAVLPVLRRCTFPVAILAVDAYVQLGVYEACRELNLSIPEDVSVIGFDDSEMSRMAHPPMTILSQRVNEIGRVALELLLSQIAAGSAARGRGRRFTHQIIDMDLIERYSVRAKCD